MSVTFTPALTEGPDTRIFRLTCEDGTILGEFAGYANAYLEAQAHGLVCNDDLCQGYGADIDEIIPEGDPVPVNASNRNAMDLLAVLGYQVLAEAGQVDLYGQATPDEFLGRVEMALALAPADAGLVEVRVGNYTDCGREPGYLQDRLTALRELALACRRQGSTVTWG